MPHLLRLGIKPGEGGHHPGHADAHHFCTADELASTPTTGCRRSLLGSTGRMLCVRKARYAMESRLGLFASMRRTNSPELPTADEMTVTDGEHRKVTGGGKGGAM
jgi:hypothetical protein